MSGMVDLELVDLIRNFLHRRGGQGATMNDFVHNVDMNYDAVHSALEYLEDHGKVCHKQEIGYVVWYLNDVA